MNSVPCLWFSGGTGVNEMRKAFTKVDPPGFLVLIWSAVEQTSAVVIDNFEIRRGNCEKTGTYTN